MSAAARRYFVRGQQALGEGDLETAMERLKSAIDLAPAFANARIAYAVALARYGDCPRAAQTLRSGLGQAASPVTQAALWATLGDVLTQSGDFPGAQQAFEQASGHSSFEARAAAGMGRVYAKTGRYVDAFVQLRRVTELTR